MKKYQTLFALLLTTTPLLSNAQTLQTGLAAIPGFIGGTLLPLLTSIAFLFFIINVVRYFIIGSTEEKGRENAKNLAIYGVLAFFFLLVFWGIVALLINVLGFKEGQLNCPDYIEKAGKCEEFFNNKQQFIDTPTHENQNDPSGGFGGGGQMPA
jgi:succinate dehydrogenase/fumarate reductase cytochrome b subunit